MFRYLLLWLLLAVTSVPVMAIPMLIPRSEILAPGIDQNPSVEQFLAGMEALSRDNLVAAELAFTQAAEKEKSWPLPLLGMADISLQKEQLEAAWSWLTRALEVAPNDPRVHHAIGRYHFATSTYPQAEAAFQRAIQLQPEGVLARLDLADLYINAMTDPQKAIPMYRSVLELAPDHASAHHGLGMALFISGNFEEAEPALRLAAESAPANPLPRQALGRLYLRLGKEGKALEAYDAALAIQPDFVPALLDKGDIYLGKGELDLALAAFERAVDVSPKYDQAQVRYGMVLQGLQRPAEASEAYLAALESNSRLPVAYNNLAWLALQAGSDLARAEQWARQAVALSPSVATFQHTLAIIYREQGKLADAETILAVIADIEPRSADTYFELGQVYQEQGKTGLARSSFQAALAIDGDYAPAKNALEELSGPAQNP